MTPNTGVLYWGGNNNTVRNTVNFIKYNYHIIYKKKVTKVTR